MHKNDKEYACLIRLQLTVMVKAEGKHCGTSCGYLKRDSTQFSCSLFRTGLYTGSGFCERHCSCRYATV